MVFQYRRTIRFQDTDAAGVVYFAQILSICHEAYEDSLQQAGMDVRSLFSRGAIAVPITYTEADFRRPLMCGDQIVVELKPQLTSPSSFEIRYTVSLNTHPIGATATTRHVCIDTATRQRCPLTDELLQWLNHWPTAAESTDAAQHSQPFPERFGGD